MKKPRRQTGGEIRLLHAESLRLFGGSAGRRDEGLLESAAGRAKHLWSFGDNPDIFDLAAEYGYGLARNHAFVDGNKRVAVLAMRTFLFLNGFRFNPEQAKMVNGIEGRRTRSKRIGGLVAAEQQTEVVSRAGRNKRPSATNRASRLRANHKAGSMSVREKSSPTKRSGSPRLAARAYEKQSPQLRRAGCLPLPNRL
jgi:death on curing protein